MKNQKLSFLGLGVMGYPMAGHLATAGYDLTVYNRTGSKATQWLEQYKGRSAATPAEAVSDADMVFACVGNDDDLRDITTGEEGAFASMKPASVFVDHTTASANIARELSARASELGFSFLDAPVSGGQAGAENGILTIMVGGDQAAFDAAHPMMSCYAQAATLMGVSGTGQLTKMVNQLCIAGLVQGLSEGVAFAANAGLDASLVFEVISKGAASSWQMINRAETMIAGQFDFGFAVDWMRKDLGLCFDESDRNGSELPVARMVDSYYAQVQENGGNRWDTSSLVTRLKT